MPAKYPKATHTGAMNIGTWHVPCHVLEDNRRVIEQGAFNDMLDLSGSAAQQGKQIAAVLSHKALENPHTSQLVSDIKHPVIFISGKGEPMSGYEGTLVVDFCHVILKARQQRLIEGDLVTRYCVAAENLLLSVSKVGIVALIDEATGYQAIRPRKALQELLDKYLRHHWAAWAKRFPDEFYIEMFRLKKWDWKGMRINRPAVVGRYTNDVVYSRLAPAILAGC